MTDTVAKSARQVEPWLRGTLTEVPAVIRAVLHALELAEEDAERWCADMIGLELNEHPHGLPSISFQLRHISGSIDRLLTYAEGSQLSDAQLQEMAREATAGAVPHVLLREFRTAIEQACRRVRAFTGMDLETARVVGRRQFPTTLGGLLVHIADHTQRHAGQMVTTAKVLKALRGPATSPSP